MNYWIVTFAPADSNCFFTSSASSRETDSLIAFGNELVNSFASLRPKEVNSRIIRNTVRRFDRWSSGGTSWSIKSNKPDSFFSTSVDISPSELGGRVAEKLGLAVVLTPKVSSICSINSVASSRVIDFNFSIISVI